VRNSDRRGGGIRLSVALVLLWLIIGAIAAGQRNYFAGSSTNCVGVGTAAVTILVGPLNYAGVNPKISNCQLPQPSR